MKGLDEEIEKKAAYVEKCVRDLEDPIPNPSPNPSPNPNQACTSSIQHPHVVALHPAAVAAATLLPCIVNLTTVVGSGGLEGYRFKLSRMLLQRTSRDGALSDSPQQKKSVRITRPDPGYDLHNTARLIF